MVEAAPSRRFAVCDANLPPPRPGVRHVRLPRKWIVIADDDLRRRVDRFFHYPMIALALLVLPLLIIDYAFVQEARRDPDVEPSNQWLWWLTITGLTVVWLAFLIEFIVKIAVAESRFEYLRRNWLDVVIIVIPILRPLRAAAVARTASAFTLRGVGFKCARYVFTIIVGLEATERLMNRLGLKHKAGHHNPEHMTRYELMDEVRRLRRLADSWEAWHAAEQAYLNQQPQPPLDQRPPPPSAAAPHVPTVPTQDS